MFSELLLLYRLGSLYVRKHATGDQKSPFELSAQMSLKGQECDLSCEDTVKCIANNMFYQYSEPL